MSQEDADSPKAKKTLVQMRELTFFLTAGNNRKENCIPNAAC